MTHIAVHDRPTTDAAGSQPREPRRQPRPISHRRGKTEDCVINPSAAHSQQLTNAREPGMAAIAVHERPTTHAAGSRA
ncbi:hypothetical protein [Stackebrandtia nassauensis]|uniref:Uncharacterized protein n=1 Tax=Stackebrandtia nassauensis (strain DSM 44728 / CIP 108903 / NRRL B-16338 / NBRC 102104 / LLR-40K-21) TaxID=446470 RepID=D3Q0C0_STANL|nr:hypothetical protein [Stackebrandtia nassauensis]ADD39784.1 hypothetical protein Snas_0062 [Stackebrandtia nassauensis DSM 44728]